MEFGVYILFSVTIYGASVFGSPTRMLKKEDNNGYGCVQDIEMFGELKEMIKESREAVLRHICEKLDKLKVEIKQPSESEVLALEGDVGDAAEGGEEGINDDVEDNLLNEGAQDICQSEQSLCGEYGECIPSDDVASFTCYCEHGYFGETCQYNDRCTGSFCLNGGECANIIELDTAICKCPNGWAGRRCEMKIQFEQFH